MGDGAHYICSHASWSTGLISHTTGESRTTAMALTGNANSLFPRAPGLQNEDGLYRGLVTKDSVGK